jgi:hypothetical protein
VSHRERLIEVRRRDARSEWSVQVARSGERAELRSVGANLDVDPIYEAAAEPAA